MRIFEIIVSKPLSNGSLVADREQRLSAYSYYPFAQADADLGANLWISHWNAPPIAPERRWSDPMGGARRSACVAAPQRFSFENPLITRTLWGRCAISHLPEPRLVDAAHIVTDADKELGSRLDFEQRSETWMRKSGSTPIR
jgi:hypothetical protein